MIKKLRKEFNDKVSKKYLLSHPYCEYCNDNTLATQVHHIIALSLGGDNRETNLYALCNRCHGMIHNNYCKNWKELQKQGIERAKQEGKFKGRTTTGVGCKQVYCITTEEKFSSIKEAAEKYCIDSSGISKNCRGKTKSCRKTSYNKK